MTTVASDAASSSGGPKDHTASSEQKRLARRQYRIAYDKANRERLNARSREYMAANRDRVLAYKREYKRANGEKISAYRRAYYQENKERCAASARKWRAENKEYRRDFAAVDLAERTGLVAMFKPAQVRSDYGNVCWACGDTKRVGIDHIIPLGRGGSNFAFNVRLLCFRCNARKRDRLDHEMKDPEFRTRLLLGHEAFTAINGDSL